MTLPLTFAPEVAKARAKGAALVALESTIITHGMPFPQNVETARAVEAQVRAHGAVPATIAIMGGRIHIGLTDAELDALGQSRDVAKLSRADLAACLATGGIGATTVAATTTVASTTTVAATTTTAAPTTTVAAKKKPKPQLPETGSESNTGTLLGVSALGLGLMVVAARRLRTRNTN